MVTHSSYRKLLTTLGRTHLRHDQLRTIHGMLTHSSATAERHYLKGNDQSVPHKAGIPLLQELLQRCSHGKPVCSVFAGADVLSTSLNIREKEALRQYCASLNIAFEPQPETSSPPRIRSPVVELHRCDTIPATTQRSVTAAEGSTVCAIEMTKPRRLLKSPIKTPPSVKKSLLSIIELFDITGDSDLPTAADLRLKLREHAEFRITASDTNIKAFNGYAYAQRMRLRAAEICLRLKRVHNTRNMEDDLVRQALISRGWFSVR